MVHFLWRGEGAEGRGGIESWLYTRRGEGAEGRGGTGHDCIPEQFDSISLESDVMSKDCKRGQ